MIVKPIQIQKQRQSGEFWFDNPADFYTKENQGQKWLMAVDEAVLPSAELSLVGRHNVANVLTVLALPKAAGIEYSDSLLSAFEVLHWIDASLSGG